MQQSTEGIVFRYSSCSRVFEPCGSGQCCRRFADKLCLFLQGRSQWDADLYTGFGPADPRAEGCGPHPGEEWQLNRKCEQKDGFWNTQWLSSQPFYSHFTLYCPYWPRLVTNSNPSPLSVCRNRNLNIVVHEDSFTILISIPKMELRMSPKHGEHCPLTEGANT